MTVARWQDPNYTTMDAATYKAALDAAHKVAKRVADAFAPHQVYSGSPNPDLAVEIDAGYVFDGSVLTEVAAQIVSGFTVPSAGQNRTDRIVIDKGTGVATRVAGTAATGSPTSVAPAIPAGKIPCCQVYITSADTVITDSMITDERIAGAIGSGVPTGVVESFAGSTVPSGWLICGGQAVSRTTYAALFSTISTQFGVGDGSTTFNVPDIRGRVIAGKDDMNGSAANRLTVGASGITGTTLGSAGGSETVALASANHASHTHTHSGTTANMSVDHTHDQRGHDGGGGSAGNVATGTSSLNRAYDDGQTNGSSAGHTHTWSGTTDAQGSGTAHQNTQPTIVLNYIIKT